MSINKSAACGLHFSPERCEKCTDVRLSSANDIIYHQPPFVSLSIPVCPLHLPHVSLHSLFFLLSLSLSSAQGQRGVWNGRNTQGTLHAVSPSPPEKDTEKRLMCLKTCLRKRQPLSASRSGCIITSLCHSGRFAFVLQAGCHGILFWCCSAVFTLL